MRTSLTIALAALSSFAFAAPPYSRARAIRRQLNGTTTTDTAFGYASQNGGTTGGAGGTETTVSDLDAFTAAVTAEGPAVVYVSGTISGSGRIKIASDKSILGVDSSAKIEGVGLYIKDVSNVIIRNIASSKVPAENGDAIGIDGSTNVWIDHVDLSSDMDNGKDYYDGLCDVTHASDWVTISNTYFHDHSKASLIGHSDSNADEDTGTLHVTYANNHFKNIGSRAPSVRFGTAHIYNSYYEEISVTGVNTRMGAQVLVESTTFTNAENPILSKDSDEIGYAVVNDVDFGTGENAAEAGTLSTVPYEYTLLGSAAVQAAVVGKAGNTLTLG